MSQEVEKPSAFKHWINASVVDEISQSIQSIDKSFAADKFELAKRDLKNLELKQRSRLICQKLHECLPKDFKKASTILIESTKSSQLNGFKIWPYLDFIQLHGSEDPEWALESMKQLTEFFTAEFAVRPYIARYPKLAYSKLLKWSKDPNPHVRRWTSEGSRPLLPWGEKLKIAVENPGPGLRILENLKFDESEYVRKSVANHLNDVSKSHPDLVIETLKQWSQNPSDHVKKIEWIRSRSLRTLIKEGNPKALRLMGVSTQAKVKVSRLSLSPGLLHYPGVLKFSFALESTSQQKQKLVLDYIIHHARIRGQKIPKVFKLKTFDLKANESLNIVKSHPFKPITTRKYYTGEHTLEIQINGKIFGRKGFKLKV